MSTGKSPLIPTIIGVAVVMLLIGVAIGSFAFPTTKTQTTTQLSEANSTETLVSTLPVTATETTTFLSTTTATKTETSGVTYLATVTTTQIEDSTTQIVYVHQGGRYSINYSIAIWTNNTQQIASGIISNVTLFTIDSGTMQVVQFYVALPSFVFAKPSIHVTPNGNGSVFSFAEGENSTFVPATVETNQNVWITQVKVSGLVELYSGLV